jgi:DNA repair protein RadC
MRGPEAEAPAGKGPYQLSPTRVKDMPERVRPREVFAREGAEAVSDRVLLAIILRSGTAGASVIDIADRLLNEYGSLTRLAQVSADELRHTKGIGPVLAQVLKSALELGRRLSREPMPDQPTVRTPEDAAGLMRPLVQSREEEAFWALLLDTKYRLRRPPVEVSKGILDASLIHPREVFKEAVRACSAAVVLVHNHPSGDPTPSAEDIRITRQLVEAGRIMAIEVLDHVILGQPMQGRNHDFLSLREEGLVAFS